MHFQALWSIRNTRCHSHSSGSNLPQLAIHTQINKLLELGVIKELQASTYGRWSMAIGPRLAQLNAVTQVPDGWLITPNMLETITRLGTMKPTCFGLLDFTAGYHQTPRPCVMSTHRCYGTERSWPLLLEQYAEQGPQRTCLRNMRNIQRALQRSSFANKLSRTVRNSTS